MTSMRGKVSWGSKNTNSLNNKSWYWKVLKDAQVTAGTKMSLTFEVAEGGLLDIDVTVCLL